MRHSRASWTQQVNIYSKNEDVAHPHLASDSNGEDGGGERGSGGHKCFSFHSPFLNSVHCNRALNAGEIVNIWYTEVLVC